MILRRKGKIFRKMGTVPFFVRQKIQTVFYKDYFCYGKILQYIKPGRKIANILNHDQISVFSFSY